MTGPPLLLVNGYAATATDWDPRFLSALERSFQPIRPDNRGVGDAPQEIDGPLTIEAMAADLEALLDELEIERLAVAGWSMGGFIAQALATQSPQRVEALVLLASDPGGPGAVPPDPGVWVSSRTTPARRANRQRG